MKQHLTIQNPHPRKHLLAFALVLSALAFAQLCAQAFIVGPYTADTNTLHLWHLDEGAVPAVDSADGGTNLTAIHSAASLGNASITGFGNCLSTAGSGQSYLAPLVWTGTTADDVQMVYANTNTGAFTYEAIIRIDFDPTTSGAPAMYILTCENGGSVNRPWQWGLFPIGISSGATGDDPTRVRLRFFAGASAVPNSIIAFVPSTGPDAIAQGSWYHVAVTFSGGTSGTLKQYWTLMDASRAQANLLSGPSTTLNALVPKATGSPCFQIGNQGRNSTSVGFNGLIDEVRMSNIERPATKMMFDSLAVVISQDPVSQALAVGQSASFSVTAVGSPPLSYQWRTNGVAIPAATNAAYHILAAQLSDAASYDVVVANSTSAATSAVATLTMRVPLNLAWIGTSGPTWDTSTVNWDSNSDVVADSVFTFGDRVRFDDNGSASPTLDVSAVFTPSSVVVSNETFDYILTTSGSGGIAGSSGLTKQGAGTLYLDIDNTYTGATDIREGAVVLGFAATRGSLGTGPVTNLATLRVDRTDAVAINNSIAGNGELINDNTGNLMLNGTNTMNGKVTVNKGMVTFGPAAVGGTTNITVVGFGTGGGITLSGGTVGSGVVLDAQTSGPDNRVNVVVASGSNVWSGPILLSGASAAILNVGGGASFEVNGPITGASYSDKLTLRGSGAGILRGTVTLPNGALQKTDDNLWEVASTGSSYLYTIIRQGVVKLGNNDALAPDGFLYFEQASSTLDLAGFNQTVAGITNNTVTARVIANSSTNSDSRLTVAAPGPGPWQYDGIIADSTGGGTRKVALSLSAGTQTLTGNSTYSGDTTVSAGTLAFAADGSVSNSTPIVVGNGATLDATARNDGTFTVQPGQVLMGNGTMAGNLVVLGTVAPGASVGTLTANAAVTLGGKALLEVNNSTATQDLLSVGGLLTYGGDLVVTNISGTAYTNNQVVKLFHATGGYGGEFAHITFPGVATYDASNLAVDGTIKVVTLVSTVPTNITVAVAGGNQLDLAWPADHTGWRLQTQTNALSLGLSTNWVDVAGATATNRVILPVNSVNGSVFFRMVYP